jgi:GT2 family glycosyltransferase/peptidoglycan/xylan/chitin deacetylase (PgdA/CDA1 family)
MMNSAEEDGRLRDGASSMRFVSILICSKARHASLLKTIRSLESYKNNERLLEIVIIEETNNPQPPTGERIRYFPIPERGLGLAFARNFGLQEARGSIVVFIDDDIVPAPHWLDALIDPFDDPEIVAVGGAVLPDLSDINTVGRCVSFLGFPAGGVTRYLEASGRNRETKHISGGNCAFRADLAREIGGFDEFMRCVEDTDFFERMSRQKKKMLFVPGALVFHKQRNSLKGVFRWFIRRGIGDFSLKCKQGGPIRALVMPVRMNFALKLLAFLLFLLTLFFSFAPGSLAVLLLTPLLWNQVLWLRIHRSLWRRPVENETERSLAKIREEICRKEVKRILFVVKFLMDLGDEVGTFIGFFRYLRNRIFSKPFVLTFHYLSDQSHVVAPSSRKYYYPAAELEELLRILEAKGYFIVSLSAMIKRLRENHKVLFLDKILAVTFDDAHVDIYSHLTRLAEKKKYPITIFVPTTLTGQMNQWDPGMDSSAGEVMDWTQIRELKDLGMEMGSHTRSHCHLPAISGSLIEEEIRGSMADLKSQFPEYASEEIIFSYPYGEVNQGIADIVKEAGYLGAVANFPRNIRPGTDPFQIPRFSVSPGTTAGDILRQSRSLWFRELAKDIRDRIKR